jgi:hypothetical protein
MFSVQSVTMLYNENWTFPWAVNEQLLLIEEISEYRLVPCSTETEEL